jgi:hypothetical protein
MDPKNLVLYERQVLVLQVISLPVANSGRGSTRARPRARTRGRRRTDRNGEQRINTGSIIYGESRTGPRRVFCARKRISSLSQRHGPVAKGRGSTRAEPKRREPVRIDCSIAIVQDTHLLRSRYYSTLVYSNHCLRSSSIVPS